MRLVDDDGVVSVEKFVTLRFRQQNAVGHQFDEAVLRRFFGEAHFVANARTNLFTQLFRDALCHAARRDASWLRVADQAIASAPCR